MTLEVSPSIHGRDVAYLFPGQGAQAVGMGKKLHDESPAARAVFEEVDEALGRPLTKLMFEGPEDELRETVNAQPAIMAVSLASLKAMEDSLGVKGMPQPSFMAGHSLGEYTALNAAGVLDVADTTWLVQERGRLMQQACDHRPGAMAAVLGLDEMIIEEISRETGTFVSNVNTSDQTVISGDVMAVARALDMATARGAKRAVPLRVGGAFHSSLMEPAREGLMEAVDYLSLRDPQIPIIGNCEAKPMVTAEDIRQELVAQICSCVHWKRSIDYMVDSGVRRFIELGPGKALGSMVKRIDRNAQVFNVGDMDAIQSMGA